ncbi:hypothetical protein Aab01nite_33480 [Paractinoplanes abujensis]|uniref:Uncharacterized protein n=1 Tax=Paractinoplanes abujensis TaxID=882441 RepID=A0A7W7D048_9ACTN|nr:DUF6461 domain-containing protein [Actinoplanes abujensis]MBB4697756.1 hypothetical protein [Actinoplanes abujensis]GID19758.1 hypothetical protein Aab01nite_33480 [Actinoplanes abujensis]
MPTFTDYLWLEDDDSELVNGFGLFWVKAVPPEQVATRAGGTIGERVGWEGLVERSDGSRGSHRLGVAELGGWSFVLDLEGDSAIGDDLVVRLSKGTTAISHFLNVELDDHYRLVEDGDVRLDFAPWDPTDRQGSAPDSLLPAMDTVGFDFTEDLDPGDPDYVEKHPTPAAFALTEYLTGVKLTADLLHSLTYLLAEARSR